MKSVRIAALASCVLAACGTNNFDGPGSDAGIDAGPGSGSGSSSAPITIGGTVTGLVGTGLILGDNGGDALSVTHDGAFTFASPAQAYAVTVLTQPSGPAQVCSVANGSGTATTNVTDVQVTCATSSFAIGGTVVGLSGTGLVLEDNGGDNLAIMGNGSFAFPIAIASGATFAVTIASQPSGPTQTCSVVGGTGAVVGAEVTSVVVNCSTDAFAIGGTVSGLAGSATLQNNGGDSVAITANGTFAFPTLVASGGTYDVTVASNPNAPDQVCTVSDGSGTVGNANVTSVNVACVTQSFAIGGTVSGLASTKQITLYDNGGDALVVGNGSFQFATPIASGKTYAVTATASADEACTVANGTGTIGSSAITNVAVTCAIEGVPTYPATPAQDIQVMGGQFGRSFAVSADGSTIVAILHNSADSWDVFTRTGSGYQLAQTLNAAAPEYDYPALSSDGSTVAITVEGEIGIFLRSGGVYPTEPNAIVGTTAAYLGALALSGDASTLTTALDDQAIVLSPDTTGEYVSTQTLATPMGSVAFATAMTISEDGKRLLVSDLSSHVYSYSRTGVTFAAPTEIAVPHNSVSLSLRADGGELADSGADDQVEIYAPSGNGFAVYESVALPAGVTPFLNPVAALAGDGTLFVGVYDASQGLGHIFVYPPE